MHRSRLPIASVVLVVTGVLAWAAGPKPPAPVAKAADPGAAHASTPAPAPAPAPSREVPPVRAAAPSLAAAPAARAQAVQSEAKVQVVRGSVPATPGLADAGAGAGRVVAIDPETGQLAPPSPEQLRELFPPSAQAETSAQNPVLLYRPNGMVVMQVGRHIEDYLFVQIGPDGKPAYSHRTLDAPTAGAPAMPPTAEER